ncbi:MAG: TonB family protein [Bacteriovoracaceae bacterium]
MFLAFTGGEVVKRIFKNEDVEIIRASVRVDVVGMPKFTIQELKEMQKSPTAPVEPEVAKGVKEVTKVEAADVIKKDDLVIEEQSKEKKKKSFLNLISDYSSVKVSPKESSKGSQSGKGSKNLDSLILEGNRLSKGTALVGDYSDQANSEFANYVQTLPELIRSHWKLPSYLLDKNLRCRIRIYLSMSGQLIKIEMQESSGQVEFDTRAEKAIRDASPFPKPSEVVGARLTSSGIILGFPL